MFERNEFSTPSLTSVTGSLAEEVLAMGRSRVSLGKMLGVSAVVHVGAIVLVSLSQGFSSAPRHLNVIETKLVRLGTQKDPELLPSKAADTAAIAPAHVENAPEPIATPPKEAPKVVPLKSTEDAAKKDKNKEKVNSKETTESSGTSALSALQRLKKRARAQEGHPDGVADGEILDPSQSAIGNLYAGRVRSCIKAHWSLTTGSTRQVQGLSAIVYVRIQADGRLSHYRLVEGSGLALFDAAVKRAVEGCKKAPIPPVAYQLHYAKNGINFRFKP